MTANLTRKSLFRLTPSEENILADAAELYECKVSTLVRHTMLIAIKGKLLDSIFDGDLPVDPKVGRPSLESEAASTVNFSALSRSLFFASSPEDLSWFSFSATKAGEQIGATPQAVSGALAGLRKRRLVEKGDAYNTYRLTETGLWTRREFADSGWRAK